MATTRSSFGRKETACAIFIRDGRLLLALRSLARKAYPNCWDIVGGHLEPGETIEQALIREAIEEVGVTPRAFTLISSLQDGITTHHLFAVPAWDGGEPQMLGDEHTDMRWFTVEEACALPALALAGYRVVFRQLPLA
jgi:8-oxo-dGTP diphosphatase